ncbi:Aldo/keto reductase, partial [Polyplosphaeria fusca]
MFTLSSMRFLFWLSLARAAYAANSQQPLKPTAISQPLIGFGTWNLDESPENTTEAVAIAIEAGYRQIDCAAAYGNEKAIGKGIAEGLKRANIKREDLWITSKLWNDHHAPSRVSLALSQTLSDLNIPYLDLYLMHWPVGRTPSNSTYHYDYRSTWAAMSSLPATGLVRHIGISNFSPAQLDDLLAHSPDDRPAVHQMELHPYLPQEAWIEYHQQQGIAVTAYSPLGNMNPKYGDAEVPLLLEHPVVRGIAEKGGCSAAQVVLLWGMSRGTSVIPKSKHEGYIRENIRSVGCLLDGGDLER